MTDTSKYGIEISWAIATEIGMAMASQHVTARALADAIGKGISATNARLVGRKPFNAVEFALAAKRLGFEPHALMLAAEKRATAGADAPEVLADSSAPGSWAAEATHDRPMMFCPTHPGGTFQECAECRDAHERWRAWQISRFMQRTGATEDESRRTLDESWAVRDLRYPACRPSGEADDSGLLLREFFDGLAELVDRLRDRQERLIAGESTHQHSVACCVAGVRFGSRVPHRSSSARSTDAAEHSRDCAGCTIAEAAHGAWVSGAFL